MAKKKDKKVKPIEGVTTMGEKPKDPPPGAGAGSWVWNGDGWVWKENIGG